MFAIVRTPSARDGDQAAEAGQLGISSLPEARPARRTETRTGKETLRIGKTHLLLNVGTEKLIGTG
jgi:hypothetical protein